MKKFRLTELIPVELLQSMQDAFSRYSGMAAIINDASGKPVTKGSGFSRFCMELTRGTELGAKRCSECAQRSAVAALESGKPVTYYCHTGMVDFASPILLNGEYVGSMVGGQARTADVDEILLTQRAEEYGIDPKEYIKEAKKVKRLTDNDIESAAVFLSEMASLLSRLAYHQYQALEKREQIEKTSYTQMEALDEFSEELKHNFGDITDFLFNLNEDTFHPDNPDSMMNYTYAMTLANNTMLLGTILEDVMDYMHIENGSFELHEEEYDPREIVNIKSAECARRAREKNNSIKLNFADDVPQHLFGDRDRIANMIGKLIDNASDHTKDDEIIVDISVIKSGYCSELKIVVTDHGEGMDKDARLRIGEYISSRGYDRNEDRELLSLGFSLIGYSLNAMSGKADIVSSQGKGTTFTLLIPQLEVKA